MKDRTDGKALQYDFMFQKVWETDRTNYCEINLLYTTLKLVTRVIKVNLFPL